MKKSIFCATEQMQGRNRIASKNKRPARLMNNVSMTDNSSKLSDPRSI